MTEPQPIDRLPTGIAGVDEITLGGIPAGRATLVSGTTGSGKTLFATEFLARGITRFDQAGVFITFEESADDIRRNTRSLGFDVPAWEAEGKWAFVDASLMVAEEAPTIGAYDFGGLIARIDHAVRSVGASRVAMDSLDAIFARFGDIGLVRHEMSRITGSLDQLGVTSVLTAERAQEYNGVSRHGVEEFVVDNVIVLRNVLRHERRRRTIEVVKLRGAAHRTGEWLFTIDPLDGMVLLPLAFIQPREQASVERVSTGNPELDAMVGGGVYRDSIMLMTGPTGTGKTLTALRFAQAGYEAGERCLLYTFDETHEQLVRNAAGWGVDLRAMEASGLVEVRSNYPEVASIEDHFIWLRRTIVEFQPHRLVIDTLSALERIVTPRALLDFVIALGSVLRQREVTTLLTSAPSGRVTPVATPAIAMEIASLTDITILLRYVERAGEIQRAIAVLQTRGSAHDERVRQFTIDHEGMHIGDRISGVAYVAGTANYPPVQAWPLAHNGTLEEEEDS